MIKGYKAFEPDLTCRGYQFEIGKTFEEEGKPNLCENGFHFCTNLDDVFEYYSFNPKTRVCEITALGEIDENIDGDSKKCTNKISIDRELSWEEVLKIINTGEANTGRANSGNRNSGNCNSGNRNSGNRNSGDCNSGDWNSGNRNSGNCNSGNRNSGDCNSGDWNSGNCNSGNCNSGNRNSGDCNSGDCNSGNCNSGDWNSGNWNSGVFNTQSPKLTMFNKPSDMTYDDWADCDARWIMNNYPQDMEVWTWWSDMTEEEKKEHPEAETTDGYLHTVKAKETAQQWWNNLSEVEKTKVMSLPNFDPDVFEEITGIKV